MSAAAMRRLEQDAELVVRRWREPAYRIALSILGRVDLAEDVAQEVILRLSRHWMKLDSEEATLAWVRVTTARRALTALSRRSTEALVDVPTTMDPTEGLAVREALQRLRPDQRALLGLALGEGWSYAEIATALKIPEGTVGSRLHAAKEAFRKVWTEEVVR